MYAEKDRSSGGRGTVIKSSSFPRRQSNVSPPRPMFDEKSWATWNSTEFIFSINFTSKTRREVRGDKRLKNCFVSDQFIDECQIIFQSFLKLLTFTWSSKMRKYPILESITHKWEWTWVTSHQLNDIELQAKTRSRNLILGLIRFWSF